MVKTFISYRRDDSSGYAGRIHDRLEREYGRDLLFMDVDAIPLGSNFVKVLQDEVLKCDVLLAIIGPNWSDARDDSGKRRLEDPNDFVRIEIATALERKIPVIPVMLEGAKIPQSDDLPDGVKELTQRNGTEVRHASFHADVDRLIKGLNPFVRKDVDRIIHAGRVEAGYYRNHNKAIEHFDKAIELDANYYPGYQSRGESHAELGNHEQAISDFSKVIRLHGNTPSTLNKRGASHVRLGDSASAIADFSKSIEVDPEFNGLGNKMYETAHVRRGRVFYALGDSTRAIDDYSEAIRINPDNIMALAARGYTYEQIGEIEKARADRELLDSKPLE